MILSNKRIIKALIRLRVPAGWSGPLLFRNPEDRFSRVNAHIIMHQLTLCMLGNFSCFCCRLLIFSKLTFQKKIFHRHCPRVKQFGSRLGPTGASLALQFAISSLLWHTVNTGLAPLTTTHMPVSRKFSQRGSNSENDFFMRGERIQIALIVGHHRPTSKTPFKWHFAGGLLMAQH